MQMAGGKAAYHFIYSFDEASLTPEERGSGTTAAPATLLQRPLDLRARRSPRNPATPPEPTALLCSDGFESPPPLPVAVTIFTASMNC